jgi:hypothetical protein
MKRTKLYRILASFSLIELNRLVRFVEDGQGKERSKTNILIHEVTKMIKGDLQETTKEQLWQSLFTGESYDDVRFRKVCSDALQLVERFLSSEMYFNDVLLESSTRLRALSRKELEPIYKTHFSRVKTLLERYPERGSDYYFFGYQVERNAFTVKQSSLQRFKIANIDNILDHLDTFYVLEKLKYYCEVLSRRTFLKHDYQNRFIDEILELVKGGEFDAVPLIKIYYQIVLTHLEPNEEVHYFNLKTQLRHYNNILPREQMKEIYTSALNYCTRKINQGKNDFIIEAFETYKELLHRELLYDRNHLSHWTFKNVVVLALRSGEYQWAEDFINQFQEKIPIEFRQNAVTYNKAQVFFYQGHFSEVLDLLQTIEYEDATYNLGAKTMLFATYYEMQEWEALHALAESFKVFIHRRKNIIPEGRRNSYLNLIKYTVKLYKLSAYENGKLQKLLNEIESSEQEIASANWIKEKIEQKLKPNESREKRVQLKSNG